MGLLDIKETPKKERDRLLEEARKYVENRMTDTMIDYLELYENSVLDELLDIDSKLSRAKDNKEYKTILHNWMIHWLKIHKRITKPASNGKKAKIHILAQELELTDDEYRAYCVEKTGKRTAKYMDYYEIQLVIKYFEDLKKGGM